MCDKPDLSSLARKWPSSIVAREQIGQFTGGLYSPSYMANVDSQGAGPEGRFRIGAKIAYSVDSLIHWLEKRSS
jgi:hypothetical protein